MDNMLKNKLISIMDSMGILYGFTECRRFNELQEYFEFKIKNYHLTEFENFEIENRINPFVYFERGKSIISIAVPYFRKGNNYNKLFSKYTQGEDYHKVLFSYLEKLGEEIKYFGYEFKMFCDTNDLPERYIAYLAGVGHIGRNSLIYTKKYGSYVFLGEIITDAYLCDSNSSEYYKEKFYEISSFKKCGICKRCLENCPNNVLLEKDFIKCVSNLTQQKKLSKHEVERLNGMIFGCDICQDVCPKNKNIEFSNEERFDVYKFIEEIDDQDIINMDNKTFKNDFKRVSCSWRGKKILKRNSIIRNRMNKDFLYGLKLENNEELNYYKNLFLKNDFEE